MVFHILINKIISYQFRKQGVVSGMVNEVYLREVEDAVEIVLDTLRQRNLLTKEIEKAILMMLAAAKEDRLNKIHRGLGAYLTTKDTGIVPVIQGLSHIYLFCILLYIIS